VKSDWDAKYDIVARNIVRRTVVLQYDNGDRQIYESAGAAVSDDGPLVRIESADGCHIIFAGGKGAERKVRSEWAEGKAEFYEGAKGAERLVCVELANGDKQFYESVKGPSDGGVVTGSRPQGTTRASPSVQAAA